MCELERDVSELDSLRTQLAKANEIISECWRLVGNDVDSKSTLPEHVNALNERVKELEDKHLNLVLWHNLDPQQAKLYSDSYANKFAIEKKIEALENSLRENSRSIAYPHGHNTDVVYSEDVKFDIEQLRKEQE